MRMKSLLMLLAFVLCTLNIAAITADESSSSSCAVTLLTDSSASSFAASKIVIFILSSEGPSVNISTLKETSSSSDAILSAEAIGQVAMNNPSSVKVTALRYSGKSHPVERSAGGTAEKHSTSKSSDTYTNGRTVNLGTETIAFDVHGRITDVITPSSILIGKEIAYLKLEYIDPSELDKGDYEILMNYLKYKLIGKDVYAKDNYAYFDLNGAINSVSINEMIQKEIWGMITGQFYFPGGGDTPGGGGGEDSTVDDAGSEDSTVDDAGSEDSTVDDAGSEDSTGDDIWSGDSTVDDIGSVDYTVNDVRVVSSGVVLQNIQNLRDLRKFSN